MNPFPSALLNFYNTDHADSSSPILFIQQDHADTAERHVYVPRVLKLLKQYTWYKKAFLNRTKVRFKCR